MELIEIFLFALMGYTLGRFLITWLDTKQLIKDVSTQKVITVLDKMIREVKVETHHGWTYWFDKENDKFLAQGENTQEVIAVLKKRFPDNVFLLPDGKVLSAPNWSAAEKTDTVVTQEMFDKFVK